MEVAMAADDVYLALVKLDDPDVRAQTSDVAQLGGELEFSDEERQIVQDVIEEAQSEDEVGGFAGGAMFGAISYCSGQVSPGVLQGNPPSSLSFGSQFKASCGAGTCTAEPKKKMPGDGGFGLGTF
jgi:hypothetical protein